MLKKIVIVFFCTILLLSIMTVPVEKTTGYKITYWSKSILTLIFLGLTFLAENLKRKYWLFPIVLITVSGSRTISDWLFLGKRIEHVYRGQDAGFTELYLFPKNKCRIVYGGIFGITEMYYGTYRLEDATIRIICKCQTLALAGIQVEIEKMKYEIKQD